MKTKLLVIGAGPYGLSMAAYANAEGIDAIIVGKPMGFWKEHMPEGMILRSGITWHLDPFEKHTLEHYAVTDDQFSLPIPKNKFIDYANWFIDQYQLEIRDVHVQQLDAVNGTLVATLDDGGKIIADNVVLAVGFKYFRYIPEAFTCSISGHLFSHTCDTIDFSFLKNKSCAILGGRQSAFESAALMAEAGCMDIHMIYDHDTPDFELSDWDWVDELVNSSVNNPGWFSNLTQDERETIRRRFWEEGRLKLEPWLADRIQGITLHPGRRIGEIVQKEDRLSITLDNGQVIQADHLLFATGYKADITGIPFLQSGNLAGTIEAKDGYPVLDAHFESSVPGLFFTSLSSTNDFGPFFGFVKGAAATALIIGRQISGSV